MTLLLLWGGYPHFFCGNNLKCTAFIRWVSFLFVLLIMACLCSYGESKSVQKKYTFTSHVYNASVPENALPNTMIVSDYMMGMFLPSDEELNIKYKIIDEDYRNIFRATSRVVGNFCFLEITVRTSDLFFLNRESKDRYNLKIKAQNRLGDKSKEDIPGATTEVRITITDLNDISPFFFESEYKVTLSEDTPLYSSVAHVKAEDPDEGLNGQVYYSFEQENKVFAIHPTSGVVSLTQPLKEQSRYELKIVAKDRGEKLWVNAPATTALIVTVKAVNIFEPHIELLLLSDPIFKGHLLVLGIVNVIDYDRGPSGKVCSLEIVEGDPDKMLRILPSSDPNEFSLAVLHTIDWKDVPFGLNLTMKAVDCGGKSRVSYKELHIPAPETDTSFSVFGKETFDVGISEYAPPRTKVVQLSEWHPGLTYNVMFSIIAGNEGNVFWLNSKSGILYTNAFLDAETQDYYSLTVAANSLALHLYQPSSVKVIVHVLDENDNPPMIVAPQGIVQVEEHQRIGSLVTQVRAQDYDSDKNSQVSYSLVNADDVPFTVDSFSGEVHTNAALDYETDKRLWKLLVRASDWGSPYRRQTEKIITINVQDVNDNRPLFEHSDCTGYVDRIAPHGTEIFVVKAVDFDAGNIISYRIVGGNDDHCFSLDAISGIISLTCDLQDLMATERLLNITATDGQHFADTLPIVLQLVRQSGVSFVESWAKVDCQLTGVNKKLLEQKKLSELNNRRKTPEIRMAKDVPHANFYSPDLSEVPREIKIRENSKIGTIVLKVEGKDRDTGYDGHLVYSIINGNEDSIFDIDMKSGELFVFGLIDRENTQRYSLNISAYDLGHKRRWTTHRLSVIVVDENDNSPTFEKTAYSFYLPENVANGTSVYSLTAVDPDEGLNGAVSYSLAVDTSDFSIDPLMGELIVSNPLDFETTSMYSLQVIARDGGGRTGYAYITIELIDTNDCVPVFTEFPVIKVPEDLPIGALVALVTAKDADSPRLLYSLNEGDHNYVFSLDEETAALRLTQPLDFEQRQFYNLSVRARDFGTPVLSASTQVLIQVVDVDENVHSPVFGRDVMEASIKEDVLPHTLVVSTPAVDGDLNPADSKIIYSLVDSQGEFYINQKGDIYTAVGLDRETKDHYWLTVRARDSGVVPRHSSLHVYVKIEDVNDNRPLSSWPIYRPAIPENSPPNSTVVTVDSTDPDSGTKLHYSITAGNPQSLFSIDSSTGEIRTTLRYLDREKQAEHVLEVTISDGDTPPLKSTAYVVVKVLDENDHEPTFLEPFYKIEVPVTVGPVDQVSFGRIYDAFRADELIPFNGLGVEPEDEGSGGSDGSFQKSSFEHDVFLSILYPLWRIIARDDDEGSEADIMYYIVNKQDLFRIESDTGLLYATKSLNVNENYKIIVEAIDNGKPQRKNSVSVEIVPVPLPTSSLNAPVITSCTDLEPLPVLESDPIGHFIKLVEAEDADDDKLWFDIIGNEDLAFDIGRVNGNIIVAGRLDAEKKNRYNLTITVTDGVFIASCPVFILVTDVNEYRPEFLQPVYEVVVSENANVGTTVFTLNAVDRDLDKHISYSLINTAHVLSAPLFSVSSLSGDVILERPLDREVKDTHTLTVGVKDWMKPDKSSYARIIITVKDYNDFAPSFASTLYHSSVIETSAIGTSVIQLSAVDYDSRKSNHITYSIVSGNVKGTFSLDHKTGVISLARSLNRKETPEYWISVKAVDNGSPLKHVFTAVNIIVKLSQEAPPRFEKAVYNFEVKESVHIGDYIGSVEAINYLGVVYSIFLPSPFLPFSVNPTSGALFIELPLDYELHKNYNFTIVASSMRKYKGYISEAASINSVAIDEENHPLVVLANDADSGHNANLVFGIVDEEAQKYFAVDSSTGAVRTVAELDYEVMPHITFGVSVRDSGFPFLTAPLTAEVLIVIIDINDVPPRFLQQEYNATIYLPTQKKVKVVQLEAIDLDFNGTSQLSYDLVDGNKDLKFTIDSSSGIIYINISTNLLPFYSLKATVSDGLFSTSTTVNIYVKPVPKTGLHFDKEEYSAFVDENSTQILVITVVHVVGTNLNENVLFSILNPSKYFTIGETSGVIQTTGVPLDRELQDIHVLIVEVKGSTALRVAHTQVYVHISDRNDNAPLFVNTPYFGVVPIDSKIGSVIFKVHATDFDEGENKEVYYELKRGNGELFEVKHRTGEIILRKSLQDVEDEYKITITAYDGGIPSIFSEEPVTLRVVDRSQPVFESQFYTAEVPEDAVTHTPVITVVAYSYLGRKLIYTISDGNLEQIFAIEYEQGVVTVIGELDYEAQKTYRLLVRATDTISGKWADVTLVVQIIDTNDNSPQFEEQIYNISVSESTVIASSILKVYAYDNDSEKNSKIFYHLRTSNSSLSEHFYMDSLSGDIFLKKTLDREKEAFHQLTVYAVDGGTPSLTSSSLIIINVADMNDNPPYFEQTTYSCGISEGAARGQFVAVLSASDEDTTNKITYSIFSGNDLQAFSLDSHTGILRVWNNYRLKSEQAFSLNISASDGVFTAYMSLIVSVISANFHSPIFTHDSYDIDIYENSTTDLLIAKVLAVDEDIGEFGKVTYHFVGDYAHNFLKIDEISGEVRSLIVFDFEKNQYISFLLMAIDVGGKAGFAFLNIKVLDVNDNYPIFIKKRYKGAIHSNSTEGTLVVKVFAEDRDSGENGTVVYGFHENVSSDIKQAFNIDHKTGEIRLRSCQPSVSPIRSSPLDYYQSNPFYRYITDSEGEEGQCSFSKEYGAILRLYKNSSYEFVINASDSGNRQRLHSNAVVSLQIINDFVQYPQFLSQQFTFPVSEKTPSGTEIGSVAVRYDASLVYSVFWSVFDVSPPLLSQNGLLSLTYSLDYEQYHSFNLIIEVSPTEQKDIVAYTLVTIEVEDVNDNAPVFDSSEYHITIVEGLPIGSDILKVGAQDADSGKNSELRYAIKEENHFVTEPLFVIDLYSGWLSVNGVIDAEKKSKYILKVEVADGGLPSLKSETSVIIEVLNINDNPPVFSKDVYYASVKESALPGTVVLNLEVEDHDIRSDSETEVNHVIYITSGNYPKHFGVKNNGQVYVTGGLDRETISIYKLDVIATDGVHVSNAHVQIEILDINDNAPLCPVPYYSLNVTEAVDEGTNILTVYVKDYDLSFSHEFFLTGFHSKSFRINSHSGQISVAESLDREITDFYSLKVTVRDPERHQWECTSQLDIRVTDINDNAPVFSQNKYSVSIPENALANILLMKVYAVDADKGVNRRISYFLEFHELFELDEETGVLKVTQSLDRETKAMYNLTVTARDQGVPYLETKTSILVLVLDVNDNPPEFASHTYYTTIPESISLGSDIVRVLATSRDSGKNAEITYSVIGGNEHRKFTIHPKSGVVSLVNDLDFERVRSYLLTVQAADGGEPSLFNQASVNVTVTDVNDNAPVFIQNSYSININEAAVIGEIFLQVVATDLDSEENGEIIYAILGGNDNNDFKIKGLSGEIYVAKSLDRESVSLYELEVIARDRGIPERTGSVFVNIEVADTNDNPPVFVKNNHTCYAQENRNTGHRIYKFEVTDADDPSVNGPPYIYEIRSGNEDTSFRMMQNGELRTATKFNHKIKSNYKLLIRVYDAGRPPLYSETWITVQIIEESRYPPVAFPLHITVFAYAGEYAGGVLGVVKASDEDPYDQLSFNIIYDHYRATPRLFSIDDDGILEANGRLDEGSYRVNVSVTDGIFSNFVDVQVEIRHLSNEMINNAVVIHLAGATPEEFLLSYRRSFHRAVRSILKVRSRDIVIISIQENLSRFRRNVISKHWQKASPTQSEIEILFVVHVGYNSYYSRSDVIKELMENLKSLENVLELKVVGVMEDECSINVCFNGICKEKIFLDEEEAVVSTDTISFISLRYHHKAMCTCFDGFSGALCNITTSQCAFKPCPSYTICIPDTAYSDYKCLCPKGFAGPTCSLNESDCKGKENIPLCYRPLSPMSLKGNGYLQYQLKIPIERHFSFGVWFRTLHSSGVLMFTGGRIDFGVLELDGGHVRYRWDLGSGEGHMVITDLLVNDGNWHYVFLERRGNVVFIKVDGTYQNKGVSPGASEMLNMELQNLYLGAEVISWSDIPDPQKGLVGCLDMPSLDSILLPISLQLTNEVAMVTHREQVLFQCHEPLKLPGACGTQPCLNGGSCEDIGGSFRCFCYPRFKGRRCEIDSKPCASSPCLNGGKCTERGNSYECHCPSKVSGTRCQFRHCNPNPCFNRGICEEGISGPICKCQGFTGPRCSIDVNECDSSPCYNGGTCYNTYGGFKCICLQNSTGTYCDISSSDSTFISFKEIMYIVIAVSVAVLIVLIIIAIWRFRLHKSRRRQLMDQTNHVILKPKNFQTHNLGKRGSKISNNEASQTAHSCTQRPDSFPSSPSEAVYMPLNNFDTIRSYGSAGDELENSPPKEFKQNISKPSSPSPQNNIRVLPLCSSRGSLSTTVSTDIHILHKPWKDALAHNLKNTFCDEKIQNDVKFRNGEYLSMKRITCDNALQDDASDRSSTDDLQGYHWDCSDWARPSQNPLPNIIEIPSGEVMDTSSLHSNESNTSGTVLQQHPLIPPDEGPVDPRRDMDTLPVEDSINEHEIQHESFELASDSDMSLFVPQFHRYNNHPNDYLPAYQISEAEFDEERGKLLNGPAVSADSRMSLYQIKNNLFGSDLINQPMCEESLSLCNTSASDLDNLCEIEDSEFEADEGRVKL